MLKIKAPITEKDPSFKVKYIGCVETFVPSGKGCTNAPVQKIWDNAGPEKSLKKITIVISTEGIVLIDSEKKSKSEQMFPIENVSFCNADSAVNERIFTWICKDDASPSLICHAVLCSSRDKAKAMALVLSRAFQIAYKEWKLVKVKEARQTHKEKTKAIEAAAEGTHPKKYPVKKKPETEVVTAFVETASGGNSESSSLKSSPASSLRSHRKDSECQTENANGDKESIYEEPVELRQTKQDKKIQNGSSVQHETGTEQSSEIKATNSAKTEIVHEISKDAGIQTESQPERALE